MKDINYTQSINVYSPIAKLKSRRKTKPTRYGDSDETTTGKPL